MNLNLAEKYRAKKYFDLIGQDLAVSEIKSFLKEFPKKKGVLLHGPAGTGKTSLALAIAKENNLEVLELNASDLRNRKKLEEILKPATEQMSLFKTGKILLMDEADGITGTDIGGVPELIRILESSKYPIVLTCNDVWQSKLAPLRTACKLIELKPLNTLQVIDILKNVAEKEGLRKDLSFLNQLAIKSRGDVRAALNDLQSYSSGEDILVVDQTEKRDIDENIFNILRKIFKERQDFLEIFDSTTLSLDEILLWIEENIPKEYKNEALVKAYDSLSSADLFRGRIYLNQSWRFLIYQNIFQSAGISYAKDKSSPGFTKYERPKRILKIWMSNQKQEKKKTISRKYAHFVHCSTKRAMRDFNILKPILKQESTQAHLKLTEEEIEFLNKI
jgi:replication factor C large subunit